MSLHDVPLPVKPVLHAHENEPALLVQVAAAWQLCVPSVHSLLSLHDKPLPV
jgi:hypothetical protein